MGLSKVRCALFEVFIQKFAVLLAFLDDLKGVVAGEVDEPFAGDVLKVMGFCDLEPAVIDPSADGFVLVSEDGFHVLWRDDVGDIVPRIVEPSAEVSGDLLGIYVILIRLVFLGRLTFARFLCGKGDGDKILFGVLRAVLYVLVKVFSRDYVTMCFLAGILAGNHSVLEHPGAFSFADM